MRLADTVTRLRAPLVPGAYGNDARDWDNATSTTYPAEVQPVSSTEDVVNQQRTITRWRMFLNGEADLEATDRIEWDDGSGVDTYEIDGDVETWKRRGVVQHLEAVLMKASDS